MILYLSDQTVQYIAWFLAMVAGTLTLYILALNWRNTTNQLVALLLVVVGVNNYYEGALIGARDAAQASLPVIFLAITTPMTLPLLMIITPRLLKPEWLVGRWRWVWWGMGALTLLPVLLSLADLLLGTRLYFTGLSPTAYAGGFERTTVFTDGLIAPLVKGLNIYLLFLVLIVFYLYIAIFDKSTSWGTKTLAWVLFISVGVSGTFLLAFQSMLPVAMGPLLSGTLFAFAYGYAAFQQMISERRQQRGSLRVRLTFLVLVVTVPLLITLVFLVTAQASAFFEKRSSDNLQTISQENLLSVQFWLDANVRVLQQAASLPDVSSMQADRQKPVLESLAATYEYMYLVSTTGLDGKNLARSDVEAPKDYADRNWFKAILQRKPAAYQVLVGRTSDQPSLVVSAPIYGSGSQVAGVIMFASELTALQSSISSNTFGETGMIYLVDEQNQVITHPDQSYTTSLRNLSDYPPVAALAQGKQGLVNFTDERGVKWRAFIARLENGWGIVAQETEAEVMAPLQALRQVSIWVSVLGLLFLTVVVWLTMRQSLYPIQSLTATAAAISEGNLNRKAPVESQDELGFLAETFNKMTKQLKDSISNLEERIARRTADLERRSNQFQAAAMVSREAAGIRDIQQMLTQTTHLISRYFDFYHAGIFIIDDAREYAVLQAANSEGGQRMLARGHKLRVGQVGIVGYVADVGMPRIALDVGDDAVFFNNPDLPMTRSEMALPLKVRGYVIGVLDVQSIQESAFTKEDVEVLQIMADQIALALENVRLLKESQDALDELQKLYGQQTRQAWKERLEQGVLSAQYSRTGLSVGRNPEDEIHVLATGIDQTPSLRTKDGQHEMQVPIILRGQVLGSLLLRREISQPPWSQDELHLATDLIAQVLPALENARLLEGIRSQVMLESLVGQVSSKIQSSLDLETILKTAVQEIGLATNAARVQIRLENARAKELPHDG